ncbi:MAG: guanylate kinase [Bacteroidales bacterium]|nr:guanylate kinase [Bacteroidales bacterium]MBP5757928.1 guanylate kinase [Bacteroidales bacterium]
MEENRKVIIFSAPSGSGKSTIIGHLLKRVPGLEFSISATSRKPRQGELDGKDYYFLTEEDFKQRVSEDKFVEWVEVYQGTCYGTLKSEIERIWDKGNTVIFDVDVLGGVSLKKIFGEKALSIFIQPPSIEVLEQRLRNRGTETEESLRKRIERAEMELQYSNQLDVVVVNDNLDTAINETETIVNNFLNGK